MLKKVSKTSEIKYILDHIRNADKEELIALYGNDWYIKTLNLLKDKDFLVLYGRNDTKSMVPVAMGGVCKMSAETTNIACVWLCASVLLSESNLALAL